jgi:hypothetical protein
MTTKLTDTIRGACQELVLRVTLQPTNRTPVEVWDSAERDALLEPHKESIEDIVRFIEAMADYASAEMATERLRPTEAAHIVDPTLLVIEGP